MSLGLYVHGDSPLHRAPAGAKVLALAVAGTLLFTADGPVVLLGAGLGVAALWRLSGLPARAALAQLRPALWPVLAVVAAQALLDHWTTGLLVALRILILLGLAALVSLTTRVSDSMAALERALRPLARLGLRPEKASLALSLAIRFIPVIAEVAAEVREAQRARGLERSVTATVVPLIVRTLRAADEIADAIDARSFGGEEGPGRETGG